MKGNILRALKLLCNPFGSTPTQTHFLWHTAVPQPTLWWQWWPHHCRSESGPWTAGWRALAGSGWSPGSSPCSADPGGAREGEQKKSEEEEERVREVEVKKKNKNSTSNGQERGECSLASVGLAGRRRRLVSIAVTGNGWRAFTDLQAVEEVGGRR